MGILYPYFHGFVGMTVQNCGRKLSEIGATRASRWLFSALTFYKIQFWLGLCWTPLEEFTMFAKSNAAKNSAT